MTDDIEAELRTAGFAIRSGAALQARLQSSWQDWRGFASSWNDLGEDRYMADGGRYRRRRYSVFEVVKGSIRREAHQPHYQAKVYNRLNGGLERWFEPVLPEIGQHPITLGLIRHLAPTFGALVPASGEPLTWHVELHQFRIEATSGRRGQPTPEGVHRDGVDGAFVMLVGRNNIASGVTQIFDPQGAPLGSFTLTNPGDAVFLDDTRVFHGVTPVTALEADKPATRDVLVMTFTRKAV